MIITLKGCTATAFIGGLNFFKVSRGTVSGASVTIVTTTINKDVATSTSAREIATVALKSNYENLVVTVTMGGTTVNWFANGKVTIPANTTVTGDIKISASATAVSGGVVDPEEPGTGGDSGEVITGTLPLFSGALSVVSGESFYRPASINNKRMNSSDINSATGIYVENGYTITLTGVSGLRIDYVYAESAGPNGNNKKVNTIKGVGTASNFVADNYFPLNADGTSNTIEITNNLGKGYYYHFAFAAPNKNDVLTPSNYNITYKIEAGESTDTSKYTLIQGGINITPNEDVFGNVLGSTDVNYKKRGHTEPAILIKNGESVTISGLTGLRLDAIWYNSPAMNNANAVGSASNKVTSDYFTLTDGTVDTYVYTNSTGNDYYFAFIVRNTGNTEFTASDYTLSIS